MGIFEELMAWLKFCRSVIIAHHLRMFEVIHHLSILFKILKAKILDRNFDWYIGYLIFSVPMSIGYSFRFLKYWNKSVFSIIFFILKLYIWSVLCLFSNLLKNNSRIWYSRKRSKGLHSILGWNYGNEGKT